jgi:hypothetical protein
MASYTVTSASFAKPLGTVLSDDDLAGCNIAALVEGGHLELVEGSETETATETATETPSVVETPPAGNTVTPPFDPLVATAHEPAPPVEATETPLERAETELRELREQLGVAAPPEDPTAAIGSQSQEQ